MTEDDPERLRLALSLRACLKSRDRVGFFSCAWTMPTEITVVLGEQRVRRAKGAVDWHGRNYRDVEFLTAADEALFIAAQSLCHLPAVATMPLAEYLDAWFGK